jgi:hypothetical protein
VKYYFDAIRSSEIPRYVIVEENRAGKRALLKGIPFWGRDRPVLTLSVLTVSSILSARSQVLSFE